MRLIISLCLALLAAACAERTRTPAPASVDDFGDSLSLAAPPARIVSLNPTITEMIFALRQGQRLVGRTTWDLYPDSAKLIPDLGNGIRPNVEAVLAARPDLVVLYASADNESAARALRAANVATLALKIDSIAEFHRAIALVGRALGDSSGAAAISDSVRRSIERARDATKGRDRPTVFWHMWDSPLLTIGAGSYLSELVGIAGGKNIYDALPEPSPQVAFEDLAKRDPEIILAAPQGVARIVGDPAWQNLRAVRNGRVLAIDTTLVFRPSLRLGEAALSLARLIHPGSVP